MQKSLFSGLFIVILPVCLSLTQYAPQPESINVVSEIVISDTIPAKSKSNVQAKPKAVKSTQLISPVYYTDSLKTKGNVADTAGVIYELNAFYPLGR